MTSLVSCCARIVNQNKWPTLLHDRADVTVGYYMVTYLYCSECCQDAKLTKGSKWDQRTGTCFIQKIYAPSSSLLQGKHLPFSPSPPCLNIFRWPNYNFTLLRYFSFRLPHLNIPTRHPSDELDKNSQRTWFSENLSHWNGYSHFRFGLNWFRK